MPRVVNKGVSINYRVEVVDPRSSSDTALPVAATFGMSVASLRR